MYSVLYSTHFTQRGIEFWLSVDELRVRVGSVDSRDHGVPMYTVQLMEVLWLLAHERLLRCVTIPSQLHSNFPFDTHTAKPVKLATLLQDWQFPIIIHYTWPLHHNLVTCVSYILAAESHSVLCSICKFNTAQTPTLPKLKICTYFCVIVYMGQNPHS
jgi:hypothetical protein